MSALAPSEIRARRRPGVLLAIAGLRLLAALCLALPFSSLIATSGIGLRAEGDRALFESGGYLLLELLRRQGNALVATLHGLLPLVAVGLLLGAACNTALLVALEARERLSSLPWLARAWARFPAQLVVAAGAGLGKLLLSVAAGIAVGAVPDWQASPVMTSAAQAASALPFVVLVGAVGGFEDVTKAALVRYDSRLEQGVGRAFYCARRKPLRVCFGWLPYAALFGLVAFGAAELTSALDVSQPGEWRVALVFLVHQLVVALGIAFRASWLARALRITSVS